jgi:hypothetical protein
MFQNIVNNTKFEKNSSMRKNRQQDAFMINRNIFIVYIMAAVFGLAGCAEDGERGATGPQGDTGKTGEDGQDLLNSTIKL